MHKLRSDDLAHLREDIARVPSAMAFVGRPFQEWFVIDANEVRDELSFLAKNRKKPDARTSLQELVDAGTVIAFAPTRLHEEVAEHLQEWAEQLGIPEDRLSQIWQDYQEKYLCFVSIPVASERAEAKEPGADPNDWPYVELYHQVGARAVVGRDSDIPRMGATQIAPEVMLRLRDHARADIYVRTIKLQEWAVLTSITVSAVLAGHLTTRLVRGFSRLPFWVQLALLVGAGFMAQQPRSRAVLAKGLNDGRMGWRDATAKLAPVVAELVAEYKAKSAEAADELRIVEQALPSPQRHRLETVAFMACLAAGEPLSLEEIKEQVILAGYRSRSSQFNEAYLRRIMRCSPRFTCDVDGRWLVSTEEARPAA